MLIEVAVMLLVEGGDELNQGQVRDRGRLVIPTPQGA
jgi:hypothetical protein